MEKPSGMWYRNFWWFLHLYWSFYITYLMVYPPLLKFLYHIPDGFSIFTEVSKDGETIRYMI
jgi:hypothetical protein